MKKQNTTLSEDLRRAPTEFLNRIFHHGAGNNFFIPPYHRFEIPPPCISRGDVPKDNWNGW